MCLNCGCSMFDDDMGDQDNITLTSVAKAAIASGMNGVDTIKEMNKSLEHVTSEDLDKKIAQIKNSN